MIVEGARWDRRRETSGVDPRFENMLPGQPRTISEMGSVLIDHVSDETIALIVMGEVKLF